MEAIISTGGKQYRVREGDRVSVEKVAEKKVSFTPLFVTKDGQSVKADKAVVEATVVGEESGDKLVVFKMKAKKRYRRKAGHRQHYSVLKIDKISA